MSAPHRGAPPDPREAREKALAGTFAGSIAHVLNNLLTTAHARRYSRMKESPNPDTVEVERSDAFGGACFRVTIPRTSAG